MGVGWYKHSLCVMNLLPSNHTFFLGDHRGGDSGSSVVAGLFLFSRELLKTIGMKIIANKILCHTHILICYYPLTIARHMTILAQLNIIYLHSCVFGRPTSIHVCASMCVLLKLTQ